MPGPAHFARYADLDTEELVRTVLPLGDVYLGETENL